MNVKRRGSPRQVEPRHRTHFHRALQGVFVDVDLVLRFGRAPAFGHARLSSRTKLRYCWPRPKWDANALGAAAAAASPPRAPASALRLAAVDGETGSTSPAISLMLAMAPGSADSSPASFFQHRCMQRFAGAQRCAGRGHRRALRASRGSRENSRCCGSSSRPARSLKGALSAVDPFVPAPIGQELRRGSGDHETVLAEALDRIDDRVQLPG